MMPGDAGGSLSLSRKVPGKETHRLPIFFEEGKYLAFFRKTGGREGGRASASRNFALQQGFCIFRSLFFPHTRLSSFLPYFSSPLSSSSFGTLKAMGKAGRREKQTDRRTHERELQYTAKAVAH